MESSPCIELNKNAKGDFMNKVYQKECESSFEYSLADYMGDVKKILTVSAAPIPSGKFVGDGDAEFSGIVSYDILYSDTEGKLTRISASSDYDVSVPIESEGYKDSQIETRAVGVAVRLTGPRKLIAKATLSNNVRASYEDTLEVSGSAFSGGLTPETAKNTVLVEDSIFTSSAEREYAEEAERLPGISADDIEIIATSGAVRILEATAIEGGVLVKGEIIITSIVRTENQPPFAIKKTVPFEETVSAEGATADMQVMADGCLTSVTSGVSDDAEGASVTVNAICELKATLAYNHTLEIMTDAYLKNRDTESKYEDFEYAELIAAASCEETFSASVSRSDIGCEEIRDILALSCEVRSFEKSLDSRGFNLSGEAALSGIACEVIGEGETGYLPLKFTVPFNVRVDTKRQIPEGSSIECFLSCPNTERVIEGERLSVKNTLKISYRISKPSTLRRITACNAVGDREYHDTPSVITVYYPEPSESLFDIAKAHHTTVSKLAADNNLDVSASSVTDAPLGVKMLIIK